MPNWLCRWPNGDVTLVNAEDEDHAIIQLDEFGNADNAELYEVASLMVDLRLDDRGALELRDLGEHTEEEIMGLAFPELREGLRSSEFDDLYPDSEEYLAKVRPLVEHERKRRFRKPRKKSKEPATLVGKDLQELTRAATAVVDNWVKCAADKILEETDDKVIH